MHENGSNPLGPMRSANTVRDHLANERTFLAWVRTSLGLIGIGFVLARMGVFLRQLAMVSTAATHHELRGSYEFLVTGVIFLGLVGTAFCIGLGWFYQRSRIAIDAGRYEPARHSATALTVAVGLGSLAITGLLLWQLATLQKLNLPPGHSQLLPSHVRQAASKIGR